MSSDDRSVSAREAIAREGGLATRADVAELLDVSRQRVDALLREHDDFPRPIAGRFIVGEVLAWRDDPRRQERLKYRPRGRPPPEAGPDP